MNEEEKKEEATQQQETQQQKTFTQEELNRIIAERLMREKKQREQIEQELKKYKEQVEKDLPEAERYKNQLQETIKQLEQTQRELNSLKILNLKLEILDKEGLPKVWAKRIQGETEEDIRKDIEELKKLLGYEEKKNIGNNLFPKNNSKASSVNDLINNALRKALK